MTIKNPLPPCKARPSGWHRFRPKGDPLKRCTYCGVAEVERAAESVGEPKPEKIETKPEKIETKAETKPEKIETKAETKPETKAETKAETEAETKAETKAKLREWYEDSYAAWLSMRKPRPSDE